MSVRCVRRGDCVLGVGVERADDRYFCERRYKHERKLDRDLWSRRIRCGQRSSVSGQRDTELWQSWGIEGYLETKQVFINLNEKPIGWY